MLRVPSYLEKWKKKLEWYRKMNVTEEGGKTGLLIVTQDDPAGGIDSDQIAAKIRKALKL
jgi:hypothetical protein